MNKLLKKKKTGKKKSKGKSKKEQAKNALITDAQNKAKKQEIKEAWGEEEEGTVIEFKVKEKTIDLTENPASINIDNEWKDEEFIPKIIEPKEDDKKSKKILWGDDIKKNVNYEQTVSDDYFPELGEAPVGPRRKKRKPMPTSSSGEPKEEGIRKFFNSSTNVNANLKKLMTRNGPESEVVHEPRKPERVLDEGPVEIKGKAALKYEKSKAELMREKMMKELEEKKKNMNKKQPPSYARPQHNDGPRQFFTSGNDRRGGNGGGFGGRGDRPRSPKPTPVLNRGPPVKAEPVNTAPAELVPMRLVPTKLIPTTIKPTEGKAKVGFNRGFEADQKKRGTFGDGEAVDFNRPTDFNKPTAGFGGRGFGGNDDSKGFGGRSDNDRGFGGRSDGDRGFGGNKGFGGRSDNDRGFGGRSDNKGFGGDSGFGGRSDNDRGFGGRSDNDRGFGGRSDSDRGFAGKATNTNGPAPTILSRGGGRGVIA